MNNAGEIVRAAKETIEHLQGCYEVMSALAEVRKEEIENLQTDLAQITQNLDDYATAARVIALQLPEFCDYSLPYDKMIADAARKAADALARVTAERDAAVRDLHDKMVCGVCIHSENDTDVPPCDERI